MKQSIFIFILGPMLLVADCKAETHATQALKVSRQIYDFGVRFVDVTWSDIFGNLKELTLPIAQLESAFNNGLLFDGSSVAGFTDIEHSDLRLILDPNTFSISPWKCEGMSVGRIFCDIVDDEGKPYPNDPRQCLKRVVHQAMQDGYLCLCGAELEFFLLTQDQEGNYQTIDERHYCDAQQDLHIKTFLVKLLCALSESGINPEKIHHEVAPGQFEIVLSCCDPLMLADKIQVTQHIVKTLALETGYVSTFIPKLTKEINGSGMHIHASLWKDGVNTFFDADADYCLSKTARSFISGLLQEGRGLSLLFNPIVNSLKRLVPGYEAPVYLCAGDRNRSAAIRIPQVAHSSTVATAGKAVRIEVRWPDGKCNPYLALAALFAAGLEGVKQNLPPVPFINQNLYHLNPTDIVELGVATVPTSFEESISLFERSPFAKAVLGKPLHTQYVYLKRLEWQQYAPHASSDITSWELQQNL